MPDTALPDMPVGPTLEASAGWTASPTIEWLILEGWKIQSTAELLRQFSENLLAQGIPLWRSFCLVPVLHPLYVGQGHRWFRDRDEVWTGFGEHGVRETPAFLNNPISGVMKDGYDAVRIRINRSYIPGTYTLIDEIQADGGTDYLVVPLSFANGERTALSFATDDPDGFTAEHLKVFTDVAPVMARLVEREALRKTAETLLDTYVGRDAGHRILNGQIRRGSSETIYAAIWYSDLRHFTDISATLPRDETVEMLNTYFEAQTAGIEAAGGQVLKFIGDGLMAIVPVREGDTPDVACIAALTAYEQADQAVRALNDERRNQGLTVLDYGVALHLGEVSYGNIGSATRMDFTVIGPAVNLAFRMEPLERETGIRPLMSDVFARESRRPVEPVGTYPLKGIAHPQTIYKLT